MWQRGYHVAGLQLHLLWSTGQGLSAPAVAVYGLGRLLFLALEHRIPIHGAGLTCSDVWDPPDHRDRTVPVWQVDPPLSHQRRPLWVFKLPLRNFCFILRIVDLGFPRDSVVKNPPATARCGFSIPGSGRFSEKEMVTHSRALAREISQAEELWQAAHGVVCQTITKHLNNNNS